MIEIRCTPREKQRIIKALTVGMPSIGDVPCLFPKKASFCILDRDATCEKCLEGKIKWDIKETARIRK